jgi:3-hydroxyacyl-[acyl-carrier-protein] dehydratase
VNAMEIQEIMQYLPHRFPFLLVDRVELIEPGVRIVALKNVTINEPFFPGHFPNYPVMPGVLILEAMAQAAAILSFKSADRKPEANSLYYFVGIDGARFKKPVVPGDQLRLEVHFERSIKSIWKYTAKATVGDSVVAQAELMCTVRNAA